jgi:hypothetical protein
MRDLFIPTIKSALAGTNASDALPLCSSTPRP